MFCGSLRNMILRQSPGCCLCIILCFVVSHGTGLHFVPLVGALSSLSFPVRTRYWTVVCIEVWYRGLPVLTRCKHANVNGNPCTDFVVPSFGSFKHMGSKWGRTQVLRLSSVGQHLYFSVVVVAPSRRSVPLVLSTMCNSAADRRSSVSLLRTRLHL